MAPKPEILFEWSMPRELIESEAKKLRLRKRKFFPFVFILILGVEVDLLIPVIFILQKCGPEEAALIPHFMKIFFLAGITAAGIPLVFSILDLLLLKYQKITYQITRNELIINRDSRRKITWNKLRFVGASPHEDVRHKYVLKLFYRKGILTIPLPEPDLSEEILSFVRSQVAPLRNRVLIDDIVIPCKQKITLLTLSGIYMASALLLLYKIKYTGIPESVSQMIFLIMIYMPLLLGPGTMGMFWFYRSLFFQRKDLQRKAMIYNLLVYFLILYIAVFAHYFIFIC